mmetsp:Transcript_21961/g.21244  ORF Transcript_21961/g.21244 Transcript_21961/m.21244 type:complete len:517 (+) Transcript_21961:106-1656(+)
MKKKFLKTQNWGWRKENNEDDDISTSTSNPEYAENAHSFVGRKEAFTQNNQNIPPPPPFGTPCSRTSSPKKYDRKHNEISKIDEIKEKLEGSENDEEKVPLEGEDGIGKKRYSFVGSENDDAVEKSINSLSSDLISCMGIGIGLQTAYNMIQMIGGKLDCSSTDNLTTFWFCVRLETAAPHEVPFRTWSRRSSPFDSRRNTPSDSKKNSPFASPRMSPYVSMKNSPSNSTGGTANVSMEPSPLNSALNSPRVGGGSMENDHYENSTIHSKSELNSISEKSTQYEGGIAHTNTEEMNNIKPFTRNLGGPLIHMISEDHNDSKIDINDLENCDDAMYSSMQNSRYKISPGNSSHFCQSFEGYENENEKNSGNFKILKNDKNENEKIDDEEKKRILIVDDSMLCQKIITKVLDSYCYMFETAGNGKEACEKVGEKPLRFDAVLMDLRMPIMDGIEATRYIRDVLGINDLPIIALTAEIGIDARKAVLEAGANIMISKPAQAQDIIRGIEQFIYPDLYDN